MTAGNDQIHSCCVSFRDVRFGKTARVRNKCRDESAEEFYCERGVSRSLIRNAMKGRLPEIVRVERRRGLQAADMGIHFRKEWPEALVELARMKQSDLVQRALDLRRMEEEMQLKKGFEAHYMHAASWGPYALCGWRVQSRIALPELHPWNDALPPRR
ncbi:MAG: hypothetical protein HY881_21660 [Deltaproteobacteria bacterium]|nr:hypothetical protein [Deltaproteobacteria bacterium]